jgi:hypothetical protein
MTILTLQTDFVGVVELGPTHILRWYQSLSIGQPAIRFSAIGPPTIYMFKVGAILTLQTDFVGVELGPTQILR